LQFAKPNLQSMFNISLQRTPHRGGTFTGIMTFLGRAGPLSLLVRRTEDG
jgi:hypothetical protein